jgi:hypothetical protein
MLSSPRSRMRAGVAIVAVVVILGVTAVVVHYTKNNEPPLNAAPPAVSQSPPEQPAVTPAPSPEGSGTTRGTFVPTRFTPRAPSSHPRTGTSSGGAREKPPPSHPPSGDGFPWTHCRSMTGGGLACSGNEGTFSCTTASNGDTSCTGSGVSFTCSTDAQTGTRGCDGDQGRWHCGADPLTGDTHCGGTTGAYSCSADPGGGVSEECSGSHTFYCYDEADGRHCKGSERSSPDCYFEPVFGAFCRD